MRYFIVVDIFLWILRFLRCFTRVIIFLLLCYCVTIIQSKALDASVDSEADVEAILEAVRKAFVTLIHLIFFNDGFLQIGMLCVQVQTSSKQGREKVG